MAGTNAGRSVLEAPAADSGIRRGFRDDCLRTAVPTGRDPTWPCRPEHPAHRAAGRLLCPPHSADGGGNCVFSRA